MNRSTVIALAILGLSGIASADLPKFKHVARVDLFDAFNPIGTKDVGEVPGDLAYDSATNTVYVAGLKGTNGPGRVGVIKIADPFGVPTITPFTFVDNAAGGSRESRLEFLNNTLYFGYGLGETSTTLSGIRKYAVDGTQDLAFGQINATDGDPTGVLNPNEIGANTGQRTEAFAIDPFQQNTLAALNRGRGFVFRFSSLTGINAGNAVFSSSPSTTGWRDLTFDLTGGIYTKRENLLYYSSRNGATALGDPNAPLVNLETKLANAQSTCEFVPAGNGYDACIMFNTRTIDANWLGYVGTDGKPVQSAGAFDEPVNKLFGNEPIEGMTEPPAAWTNNLLASKVATYNGKQYLFVLLGGGGQKLDIYEVAPNLPEVTVQGTLDVGSYEPTTIGAKPFTIEVRKNGTTLETKTVSLDSNFHYSFSTTIQDTVDIAIRGTTWLRRVAAGVVIGASGATVPTLVLPNGDIDGDNCVTVFDYTALSDAFDSIPGDANWLEAADLDGDSAVTVFDYNILSENFDKTGDD